VLGLLGLLGCGVAFRAGDDSGAGGRAEGGAGEGGAPVGGGKATSVGGTGGSTGGSGPSGGSSSTAGGGKPQPEPIIYAASRTELYAFDPLTEIHTFIGSFSGCPNVYDLALSSDGELYAVTQSSFESVDPATAACTEILGDFVGNALAFVPVGTVDAQNEALVAWDGNVYMRVDPSTGATTTLGTIESGYASSGDFVAIGNGRGLITVYGNGCSDCILEVDVADGTLVENWGPVGFGEAWGLARWDGTNYLWSGASASFELELVAGAVTVTPIANTPVVEGGYPSAASAPDAI